MDIRRLTEDYAVSPQIAPADIARIAAEGFNTLICNRPDAEIPEELHADRMRAAAEAAGLQFIENPFPSNALSLPAVAAQRDAIAQATGPVLAYCNSGTRSTVIWLFASADRGDIDALLRQAEGAGYRLSGLKPQLEAFADQQQ